MRIAAIATMKTGLEHFVYRDLSFLSTLGISIELFPTKFRHGLYNARPEWKLHRWRVLVVLLLQPWFFLRAPRVYLRLLAEAIATGALADFALACYFAPRMRHVDAIYVHFGDHKLFVGYFCKKLVHKPLVVTIHAYELYQNPNPRLFLRALSHCDRIITPTEHNREYLAKHFGVHPSRVELVRYSVDTQDYRPGRKFVILIVGYFVEKKGHEVLLRAVKQLQQDDIEVWVVGGEGGHKPAVDVPALAARLGVEHQVAFFGKLKGNALKAVFRACDVFCLPCRHDRFGIGEGFPLVLVEAMAFGKPVITTRHVEIPRIIKRLLVEENDVAGLAQAIRQAYDAAALREEMGRENRRIAEETFSPRNVARTAAILQAVAGKRRPPEAEVPGRLAAGAPAERLRSA